jgi:glucose-6-phosphate 1-dehydrogenase
MGDLTDQAAYQKLEQRLAFFGLPDLRNNLLFYLAISPSQFGDAVENLHAPACSCRRAAG